MNTYSENRPSNPARDRQGNPTVNDYLAQQRLLDSARRARAVFLAGLMRRAASAMARGVRGAAERLTGRVYTPRPAHS